MTLSRQMAGRRGSAKRQVHHRKGIVVRQLLCCLALSAVLVGSFAQTAAAAKSSVPANLIKECSERMAKAFPNVEIVGSFFLATRSNNGAGTIDKMLDPGEVIAVAAPTRHTAMFGATNHGFAGCSYYIKNGRLKIGKCLGPTSFRVVTSLCQGKIERYEV